MQTSHYYALCRQVSTTTYSTTTCRQAIEHDGNFYNIDITTTHLTMCSTLFHSTVRRSSTRKCSKMLLCLIQPLHCWCERMTNAEVTAGCRLALSIYSNASSFSESFSSSLLSFFSGSCRSLTKIKLFTDQVRPALGSGGCSVVVTILKNLKTALFQTFSTWHPNTFCSYCLILTLYHFLLTQYHQVPTSIAPY